jgi:hypothetical protein
MFSRSRRHRASVNESDQVKIRLKIQRRSKPREMLAPFERFEPNGTLMPDALFGRASKGMRANSSGESLPPAFEPFALCE